MRLAIADPPYPPNLLASQQGRPPLRASRWYGDVSKVTGHPAAAEWDAPARHRELLAELDTFDGWALATTPDALTQVYAPLPRGTRVLAWVRPNAMPTGARVASMWEPVIVRIPASRRRNVAGLQVRDVLTAAAPRSGFAGAKPPEWTRWVLDALGYDPDTDELLDMFPGSGAVAAAAAQGVLSWEAAQ